MGPIIYKCGIWGKEQRVSFERQKLSKFNRRTAFMHKTHMATTNASFVFKVLGENDQDNWSDTARELTTIAYGEYVRKRNDIESRKSRVPPKGPFGSVESSIPLDVDQLFAELSTMRANMKRN